MRTLTYSGTIDPVFYAMGSFDSIGLVQKDGYILDLVYRLSEGVNNYGGKVNLRYWIAPEKVTKEEAIKGFMAKVYGGELEIEHDAQEYSYSEYTHGVDYETIMNVSRHNLYNELRQSAGKYLILEIDFVDAPNIPSDSEN